MNLTTLNKRISSLKAKMTDFDYPIRGSLVQTYMKCGKKQCACHKDPSKRHGPYYHFTRKVKGKTVGRLCSKNEVDFLMPYVRQYHELTRVVRQVCELSEQAVILMLKNQSREKTG